MSEMLFVRHGETEWNRLQRYQGIADIPLNEKGIEQACAAAEEITHYLEDRDREIVLYASTLSRARKTAAIIAEAIGVEVRLDERLCEMGFGDWEGLTFTEVYERYRSEFDQWYNSPMSSRAHGGESLGDVLLRSREALREISDNHPSATIIIVTHGGVIKTLLYDVQPDYPLWDHQVSPGSVTKIDIFPGK